VVPKDATQATVIIRNKTRRPLSIRVPDAFVGMPVLAQAADRGNGRGGGGGGNTSTSSQQSFGGGMGGGMMGGMGGMGMGGFFDVGPERVSKVKLPIVCLEHGKEDPNPRVAYELKPIEEFTDQPALVEICKMLGQRKLDQATAQAAAWHLSDGLSWNELARKIKVKHLNGQTELFFNAQQLRLAFQAVQVAHHRTKEQARPVSPGEEADKEVAQGASDALSLN
jgi:hypothetical protein